MRRCRRAWCSPSNRASTCPASRRAHRGPRAGHRRRLRSAQQLPPRAGFDRLAQRSRRSGFSDANAGVRMKRPRVACRLQVNMSRKVMDKTGRFQYSLPRMKPTKAFSPGISSKRLDQALRFAAETTEKRHVLSMMIFIIYMNGEACSSFDAERRLTGYAQMQGNEGTHTASEAGCLR